MSAQRKWRRRTRKTVLWATLIAVAVAGAGVAILRGFFHGERLAQRVTRLVNDGIRGKTAARSMTWEIGDLPGAIATGWLPVVAHDVEVYAADGELVLSAPRITGEIHLGSLSFRRDFQFRDMVVHGAWTRLREAPEPYPEYPDDTAPTLISAFEGSEPPPPRTSAEAQERSSTWHLQNFRIDDATIELAFYDFEATVDQVSGRGWLHYAKPAGDPRTEKYFSFDLTEVTAGGGRFHAYGLEPFHVRDVQVEHLRKVPPAGSDLLTHAPDLEWRGTAVTDPAANVLIDGAWRDYWLTPNGGTYDITVTGTDAGALLAHLSAGVAGGERAGFELTARGPHDEPLYALTVTDFDVAFEPPDRPPLAFEVDSATATLSRRTQSGALVDTVARGAGGELILSATYSLEPLSLQAGVAIPQAIDVGPWLDPEITRATGGGRLTGSLNLRSVDGGVRAEELNITLGQARMRGALTYTRDEGGGTLHTDDFRVAVGKSWVQAERGTVDLARRTLDLAVRFASDDLRTWLRRYRQPAFARAASGSGRVTGTLDAPVVPSAEVSLRGVPIVETVSGSLGYRDGLVSVRRAKSKPFGGELIAEGKLALGRRPRLIDFRVGGTGLALSKIPGMGEDLSGTARVHAVASGPLSSPTSTFVGEIDDLHIAGEAYRDFLLNGATDGDGSAELQLHLERERGGRLDFTGSVDARGDITGVASVRDIPLHTLPWLRDARGEAFMGGVANAELQMGGAWDAPAGDGYVEIARSWFKDTFLGNASIELERIDEGRMRIHGRAFQGSFWLDGELTTSPQLALRLNVGVRRVELDQFLPEIAKLYDARGWVSGEIRNLVIAPGAPMTFTARLTEAVILIDNEDDRGRPQPVKVRAVDPIEIAYDGTVARLLRPARLEGPTGEFALSGSVSPERVDARLEGEVAVTLLQSYLRDLFDEAEGTIAASVDVTGDPTSPRVTGVLGIRDVRMRPSGQDAEVRIPAAKIEVTNDLVSFTGFTIQVVDEITGERDDLNITGNIVLRDFEPADWALIVHGELSGKLLLIVAPNAFTAASGNADVDIFASGSGRMPDIEGSITFDPEEPLTFTPRGLRREILLDRGSINYEAGFLSFEGIGGTIDDSGLLTDLSGEMSIEDWHPVDIDMRVSAQSLPFRIPRTLELEVDVDNLRIVGAYEGLYETSGLEIVGQIDIIDGRYIQKFNPLLDALRPERVEETEAAFYERIPLLGGARLDLVVTTGGGFGIKNNIADIDLDGTVLVTGTPNNPRLDGEIAVRQGSFKFQGMRSRFERTEGNIVFSRFQRFPDDTPFVSIHSESDYVDGRGNEHNVVLELTGTLSNLNWDLYTTNTGLNKSQTATLLISGRTTEENRSLLGDDPVAPNRSAFDQKSTASTETQLDAFDQLAKDYLGDFISTLVEDPLRSATGVDVFRIEVGTSGVGGRVEENLGRNTKIISEFEQTLRGRHVSVKGEHRVLENLSVEVELLWRAFFEDVEEDQNEGRVQGTIKGKYR